MNTDGKMSFKKFVFPVNPAVIRIAYKRSIARQPIPYANSVTQDMGRDSRIVTGEGEFYGTDCQQQFESLKRIFDEGGGGMLYIPSQKPIYALFGDLQMIGSYIEGVIGYRFTFTESFEKSSDQSDCECLGNSTKTLWDISYEFRVAVEELMELNPDIARPDQVIRAGRRVRLC